MSGRPQRPPLRPAGRPPHRGPVAATPSEPAPWRERLRALRPILIAALFFGVAAALGVAHVTLRLRELDVGHALARAAQEQRQLAEERRRLRIEVASLKSPARVIPLARKKLRLVPPRPEQIRTEARP